MPKDPKDDVRRACGISLLIVDQCRQRKRKCDMQQPYCSYCVKSGSRNADGNPCCTYPTETKKRGPKKGYKDHLLQRLEAMEARLNPVRNNLNSNDAVGSAINYGNSVGAPGNNYNGIGTNYNDIGTMGDRIATLAGLSTSLFSKLDSDGKSHQLREDIIPFVDEENSTTLGLNLPAFNESSHFPLHSLISDSMFSDCQFDLPDPSESLLDSESLEVNLVRLGYVHSNHVQLSVCHSLEITSAGINVFNLPVCIKEALSAHGVLYSKHPDLFSTMLDSTEQHPAAVRLRMTRMYIRRCEQSVQIAINAAIAQLPIDTWQSSGTSVAFVDNQADKCDTTRALLIIAMISYGLGDGRKAMGYIREAYEFSHRYRLFHPFVFQINKSVTNAATLNADDLMFNVPPVGHAFPVPLRELTSEERNERFILWGALLAIDTYASFVAGHTPNVDELVIYN